MTTLASYVVRHRASYLAVVLFLTVSACQRSDSSQQSGPRRFASIGREAQPDEIMAWDIDFNPSGAGLPAGQGTYARGTEVYAQQCASCHGAKGEGVLPNTKLVSATPTDFSFARDPKAVKTIGNYWPYATTLYDYINRAMPFGAPGTLPPADVYSVVAFLLAENGIIEKTAVMDARTLPQVRMPARDRFVVDDRKGGPSFK
jgi:mono/diheme cytochrome c family protein